MTGTPLALAAGVLAVLAFAAPAPAPATVVPDPGQQAVSVRIGCNEAALRTALSAVAVAGGGRITFDCANTTNPWRWRTTSCSAATIW